MKALADRTIRTLGGYPFSALAVAVVAVLLLPFRSHLQPPVVMLLFVPVIIGVARLLGLGASTFAAVLAFLALDFLFVPPYYRLVVGSLTEWIGLSVFLLVAIVAGQQTGRLRLRERAAMQRQEELELMNTLSFRIASARSPEDIAEFVVREVTARLGACRAALYAPGSPGAPARCLASAGMATASSGEEALVRWVVRTGLAVGLPVGSDVSGPRSVAADDAVPGITADGVYIPLKTCDSLEGVLYAGPTMKTGPHIDATLLVAAANLVATSFERRRLEEEASHAEVLREADRLKTTLVSSVSHELKTPLAAATARVTGLLDEGLEDARVSEELSEVVSDLTRLNASIADLLDLSRLESDEWRPERKMQEIGDILAAVVARLQARDRERVRFSLSPNAPFVSGDFSQLVRAFANVIENALAYSPPGSPVVVTSAAHGGEIVVTVEDRGPGVTDAEKARIFEKFYRGSASGSAPGTGLGLTIAHEIVRSHGGRITVENAVPAGSRFIVAFPSGGWAERR